jgi:hypothetical protein
MFNRLKRKRAHNATAAECTPQPTPGRPARPSAPSKKKPRPVETTGTTTQAADSIDHDSNTPALSFTQFEYPGAWPSIDNDAVGYQLKPTANQAMIAWVPSWMSEGSCTFSHPGLFPRLLLPIVCEV